MFRWFETRIDPFQPYDDSADMPPTLRGFFVQMLWPVRKVIALCLFLSAAVALLEMLMFRYVERLVDLMGGTTPATFWAEHQTEIIVMAFNDLINKPRNWLIFGDVILDKPRRFWYL